MTKTKEQIWKMFDEVCQDMRSQDPHIIFHADKKQKFFDSFQKMYDLILNECMDVKRGINTLDRHKVAGIIVVSGIESEFVSMQELKNGTVFLGKEIISLSVALSFLQAALNMELEKAGSEKRIGQFVYPQALMCKTDYFDIMARNLFYSQKYWQMNPLELAEKFFLIENYTLEKNGIDPAILRKM